MAVTDNHERLTAGLRLVVAAGALAIYIADPSEHPARRPFADGVLGLFVLYAAVSYVLALRGGRGVPGSAAPWIDAAWVTLALAVSQGTSDIFYPLYLFAILCASFRGGLRTGFAVAIASAAAFALVGTVTAPQEIGALHFVISALYLLVLGYLIAVWGGHEVRSRARLALLRDVTSLSGPRLGIDATLGRILEAVRAFFDADACRVVVADALAGARWMRSAVRGREPDPAPSPLPPDLAGALLPAPLDAALVLRGTPGRGVAVTEVDRAGHRLPGDGGVGARLLTALEAESVLSAPFRWHASASGRLYVARRARRAFDRGDAEFLRHLVEQVAPVLENLRLMDHLVSDAATEERRRIALDLHDSVIQPYLGLRLGLSAARAALAGGRSREAEDHVERLVGLADGEIETLRGYVRELRTEGIHGPDLEASVRRFCRRFSDATGIRVDVAAAAPRVDDRVASEVFQMVAEALSNVRRHTEAARAEVKLEAADGLLRLVVTNDGARAEPPAFVPRALAERAAALGGSVDVQRPGPGATAVRVEIPL